MCSLFFSCSVSHRSWPFVLMSPLPGAMYLCRHAAIPHTPDNNIHPTHSTRENTLGNHALHFSLFNANSSISLYSMCIHIHNRLISTNDAIELHLGKCMTQHFWSLIKGTRSQDITASAAIMSVVFKSGFVSKLCGISMLKPWSFFQILSFYNISTAQTCSTRLEQKD